MLTTLESTATIGSIFILCFMLSTYWVNYNNQTTAEKTTTNKKQKKENTNYLIMNTTMGLVLLVFAVPKLINIKRFYEIYVKYDLISSESGLSPVLSPWTISPDFLVTAMRWLSSYMILFISIVPFRLEKNLTLHH